MGLLQDNYEAKSLLNSDLHGKAYLDKEAELTNNLWYSIESSSAHKEIYMKLCIRRNQEKKSVEKTKKSIRWNILNLLKDGPLHRSDIIKGLPNNIINSIIQTLYLMNRDKEITRNGEHYSIGSGVATPTKRSNIQNCVLELLSKGEMDLASVAKGLSQYSITTIYPTVRLMVRMGLLKCQNKMYSINI